MHCIPAAMLLRPTSSYQKRQRPSPRTREQSKGEVGLDSLATSRTSVVNDVRQIKEINAPGSPSKTEVSSLTGTLNALHKPGRLVTDEEDIQNPLIGRRVRSPELRHNVLSGSRSLHGSLSILQAQTFGSTWSFITSSFPGSATNLDQKQFDLEGHNDLNPVSSTKKKTWKRRMTSGLKLFIDPSVARHPLAWYIVLSYMASISNLFLRTYITSLGIENGISRQVSSLFLTVMGSVETFSKLFFGFITDLNLAKPYHYIAFSTFVVGLTCQFVMFLDDLGKLMFFAVVLGLFSATSISLNCIYIVDMLGLDALGKVMAMCSFFGVSCVAMQQPLLGMLIEVTGSFRVVFQYVSSWSFLCSAMMLCSPLVERWYKRRTQNKERSG